MDHFEYRDGRLFCEDLPLDQLALEYGTPSFVYSRATLERHWRAFDEALAPHEHLVCYAVKANSNLGILNLLARLGSGFDIVSGGELHRVLRAGGEPSKVVFSGVGKQAWEMREALEAGILCFNVESEAELDRLNQVAGELGVKAPVSFRINPDVDALTHPYISTGLKENKFGIAYNQALHLYQKADKLANIRITGMDCHIGSQLTGIDPFVDALDRLMLLVEALFNEGIEIEHLDLGGGLGIRYGDENPPLPAEWASAMEQRLRDFNGTILIEPGRAIVGNAGILLTRVEYLKHHEERNFAIVDAAMNDLIRPSLYSAWQEIVPVQQNQRQPHAYDVVGPICETGDFLGKDRQLALTAHDLLAVRSSGAYGFSMSSNYNSRPRAAEILVDGDQHYLIRERETLEQLFSGEHQLP